MAADHQVCIIMLGESGVGKTSLMMRFCKNIFKEGHKSTVAVDKYNKTILLNDKEIDLELWDTAGQERYNTIIKKYFRRADGVLLAYDMTNLATFMKLSSWLDELRQLNEEATVLIVGNKADLLNQNQVSRTTVENYARDEGLDFCETSAKNNENVDEVFQNLTLKVLERKQIPPFYKGRLVSTAVQTDDSLPSIISLDDDFGSNPKKKKKGCC
ncbi:Ras-related protein Rab-12 [Araneus ventricosus]|uniref:Ras-related protein Rab-12 n=1 Tax=Araneus ventricosus TaxID=182803 RepID=A0A4Y2TU04_ARAVE|nr:Ras-related protein Rab-12 [Araneus ventricosus]GBO02877.1 Ras-related protein Rab-12 [Araneus ventricosus]GBO04687.1 Ras-related protein Rab-12 [Araneus ventricosus]GBO04689.1 Ras-related protein Rab-12 [Araneus ventricosus]